MRRQDTVRLDTHALVARFETAGLKQWALADELGVHRRTVSRWLSGRVRRLDRVNALALARVLGCAVDELLLADATDVYATRTEQRRAAALVRERELVELLSPTGDWELAERLIKATLQPDLPPSDLGRLYNLLAIAAWRQRHLDEARDHAAQALQLGERQGDRALCAKAWANLGTVAWFTEEHEAARVAFERALAEGAWDTPRDHASASFNLGYLARSAADFDRSLDLQRRAIAVYEQQDLPFNLAIAWTGLGITHTELGRWHEALSALDRAEAQAERCRFAKGALQVRIYRAEVLALTGRADPEPCLEALQELAAHPGYDPAVHEGVARVARLAGDRSLARAQLAEALRRWPDRSFGAGMALRERARIDGSHGDWRAANERFLAVGLPGRVDRGPVRELGSSLTGSPRPPV